MKSKPWVIVLLLCGGCLRPAQERAERDETIGKAEHESYRVEVSDGLAAVRELEPNQLSLWASAPVLDVNLAFTAPADSFVVRIENCLPDAEISASQGVVVKVGGAFPTECVFEISQLRQETLSLTLAPPRARELAPFRFAVLSDVQEAVDRVQDIFGLINAQPDVQFLLGAGDLTEQGTVQQLERYQREMRELSVPYFTTLGNHELGVRPPPFQEFFGRASFSFEYRGVRFTLLDSGSATLDPIVYGWLDQWLDAGRDQLHVVAMHIPPLDPIGVRNGAFGSRNEAALLLGKLARANVDLTLYGHIHSYYHFDNAGIPAHISGGGGAIPEKFDGIDRHFLVVDADPEAATLGVSVVRVD